MRAEKSLEHLLVALRSCRVCADEPLTAPLPHTPRPIFQMSATARIAVCSQAPGTRAHASGIPFSDPSGVRLRNWMGVNTEEFYDAARVAVIPMGFCFPGLDGSGGDLPPRKECAPLWREVLFANLASLDLILLVGLYAQHWHLGERRGANLTETVRNFRVFETSDGACFIPLPHPSWRNNGWLKRNPWFEKELLPVLKDEVRKRL